MCKVSACHIGYARGGQTCSTEESFAENQKHQ